MATITKTKDKRLESIEDYTCDNCDIPFPVINSGIPVFPEYCPNGADTIYLDDDESDGEYDDVDDEPVTLGP